MVSQLKVNQIIKQSGSSVTIGEAGDTITFPSSGTASGIFTSTPSAYMKLGSDQTISNTTWTKVNLNQSNWDTDSGFDSSNYKYTIPTTGKYQVNYSAYISGIDEGEYCQAIIYKNGSSTMKVLLGVILKIILRLQLVVVTYLILQQMII